MEDRTVKELIEESHQTALDKGWWEDGVSNRNILEQLMLMVTELAEAAEEIRDGHTPDVVYYDHTTGKYPDKPNGFLVELADVYIRIGDTIAAYGQTDAFLKVLTEKLAYNRTRPHRHGGKTA